MKQLNLYFIRHGQTEWNLYNKMQGSQNSPLTASGIEEAKVTGRYLADTPFLGAYSSPQQRAIETRDYILSEHRKSINTHELDDLVEMDFGTWEGRIIDELRPLPEFSLFLDHPDKYDGNLNGGEKYLSVLTRVKKRIDQLVTELPTSGNVLIVAHGNVLRILLCVLGGGDWTQHRNQDYTPRILNTSISIVEYTQHDEQQLGQYNLKLFNSVDHLLL